MRRSGMRARAGVLGAAAVLLLTSACGDAEEYDIGPIFPLSADKCDRYNGTASGEGFTASCMVTKEDCDRAAADWAAATANVPNALRFTC